MTAARGLATRLGRNRALGPGQLEMAHTLFANPNLSVTQVAGIRSAKRVVDGHRTTRGSRPTLGHLAVLHLCRKDTNSGCDSQRARAPTLADQVTCSTDLLRPLWQAAAVKVLVSTVMNRDGTSLPVLERGACVSLSP